MSSLKALSLSLLAAAFCFACSSNDSESDTNASGVSRTADLEGNYANIRYYNLDSISLHYDLITTLNEEAEKTLKNYQSEEAKKRNELQSMANKIEEKARSGGYLTQQSYEADLADLQKKQQQAENYLATLQGKAMDQAAYQQKLLLDSINSFLKDYNAVNNFDAILVLTVGSYCQPELDITKEIIDGLNARYTKVTEH